MSRLNGTLACSLFLISPFFLWVREMAQYGETTVYEIITQLNCAVSLFPWSTPLCRRRLKIKDNPIITSQITLYTRNLSSPWIQLRTISKVWNLMEMDNWQIAQTA